MSPTLIIVIAVAVIAVGVGIALTRKSPPSLPREDADKPTPKPLEADAKAPPPKAPKAPTGSEAATPEAAAPEDGSSDAAPPETPEPSDEAAEPAGEAEVEDAPAAEATPPAPPVGEPSPEEVKALKKGLASTRGGFISRLARLFGGKREIDPALLDEVEEVLITADIGVHTTERILTSLRERLEKNELADADAVWAAIQAEARGILSRPAPSTVGSSTPKVILVVGVNGVGKTTTIGKLAKRFAGEGQKVMLAAGDTFRAAAVLQLEVWGRRTGATVVKGKDRADPGSVIFDAIKRAQDEGFDLVIADTAGRLHTKTPLMDELQKVGRTLEKALGRPADETLLVLDATTGQNAIQQTELFKQALPLSGIVLTKLDGSAKGGVVLGIVDQHELPIHYLGVGERVEDLREFDAPSFAAALFERPEDDQDAAHG